jgi:hypothetical protein
MLPESAARGRVADIVAMVASAQKRQIGDASSGGCRALGGVAPRLGGGPRAASILRTPPGPEGSKGQQALTGARGPLI